MKKIFLGTLLLAAFFISCSKANDKKPVSNQSAETVLFWNEIAYNAFGGAQYQHSLLASRINAMMHLAIHDALNSIEGKYARYAYNGNDKEADPLAAAAAAAHAILVNEIADRKSFLDSALTQSFSMIKEGEAKTKGLALGKEAAYAVLAKRANDGKDGELFGQIPPSEVPGIYQPVPPFNIMFAPHWENVKLFSLSQKDQFRSKSFPALNSQEYATAFNEVKEKGKLNSGTRLPDQLAYARFWYEFSEAGWNRVARTVAVSKKLNLLEAARLFALVDMAIADAYIAGWDAKIHHNFWRPYTAIRKADADGNNATSVDAAWEPEMPTPPVHDYPSTHSALGNAAATVLAKILGDNTPFAMSSPTAFPAGTVRSFQSFSQAANENADSRVMAGIHFRFSCVAGQELGTNIGNWTVDNHLKPLK
ncbi:MAG TPA: vanadium-dependent haloperoxidase [Flavisolibacter sp.]